MLDYDSLLLFVRDGCGFQTTDEADRAVDAVLSTLGDALTSNVVEMLAHELPPRAAQRLRSGVKSSRFDREEFFSRVARREGVDEGFGLEHAEVVCAGIGAALPRHLLDRLRRELPDAAATLFTALDHAPPEAPAPHPTATQRTTLSEGRPTSRHPLSESRPDIAQTHSVVTESNPHEDIKLSSSHGLTQEALHESLATGRPGPRNPISGR